MENLHVSRHEANNVCNCNSATPDISEKHNEISLEDQVARSIHDIFDSLPAKCKPRTSVSGVSEWIPLSGIAIGRGDISLADSNDHCQRLIQTQQMDLSDALHWGNDLRKTRF